MNIRVPLTTTRNGDGGAINCEYMWVYRWEVLKYLFAYFPNSEYIWFYSEIVLRSVLQRDREIGNK